MFFSNKEKKIGGSRVLTEAEIKKKLYGDFETTSADMHSSTHEVKMSGTAFETKAAPKREFSSGAAIRSPSFGATSKPETLSPRTAPVSFSDSSRKAAPFSQSSPKGKVSDFSDRVNTANWKAQAGQFSNAALGVLTGLLWKLGSYLIQALSFVLKILDPRKPQARKLLYSITACFLVAALFFGVFRLNAQRKKAMSGELRTPTQVSSKAPSQSSSSVAATVSSTSAGKKQASLSVEPTRESALKPATQNQTVALKSASPTESEIVAVPATGGKYVIQVATYAALEDANHVIGAINQAGFSAFSKKQIRNSTGHAFYPVYLGRFESFVTAQQTLAKFRKASVARPFQDSFVRTLE